MIGVIGAMEEEVLQLKQQITDVQSHQKGGSDFLTGLLNGCPIVVCQSGVGKVNAAHAAMVLILHFKVSAIVFTGVAGAVHPSLQVQDIVLATDCLYHDVDVTPLGWALTEIPDDPISAFPCDPRISDIFYQQAVQLYGNTVVHKGRIITGDQFIADHQKVQHFHQQMQAFAVDMESAAVAHCAYKYQVPCCIIRSISDSADGKAVVDFPQFVLAAAQRSVSLIFHCITQL